MIHKAWCSIAEVPYYFSRSYIKFQSHTGWKIDDLDQIWARLLGRSQLSNPSDLPCWLCFSFVGHSYNGIMGLVHFAEVFVICSVFDCCENLWLLHSIQTAQCNFNKYHTFVWVNPSWSEISILWINTSVPCYAPCLAYHITVDSGKHHQSSLLFVIKYISLVFRE